MKKQVIILVVLTILNIFSLSNINHNIINKNIIVTSYRCIAIYGNRYNILRKDVYLDDSYNVKYEKYYIRNQKNSIFENNTNNSFYNLNNSSYTIKKYDYKDYTKKSISEYISINKDYKCAINSYKVKED